MSIEAMKQALEALEKFPEDPNPWTYRQVRLGASKAITSLRQAIADAEKQEPAAWMHWLHGPVRLFLNKDEAMMELDRLNREYPVDKDARQMRPLYTHPQPKREPLTDKQMLKLLDHYAENPSDYRYNDPLICFARAIEAAHGIKGEA